MLKKIFKAIILMNTFILLASCQKEKISTSGYFSQKISQAISRSIASEDIKKQIDSKQILIYCHNSSNDLKDCYYKNAKEHKINISLHSFNKTKKDLYNVTKIYEKEIQKDIASIINKRDEFCKQNSLHNFGRCMKMGIMDNTMEVLNESHKKINFNPHEYLYAKEIIKSNLTALYDAQISTRLSK